MNTPTLETERLILRKFTEQDMDALFLILQDEEVNRFLPWYPVKTMDEAKQFYEERYVPIYAGMSPHVMIIKDHRRIVNHSNQTRRT